MQSKRDNEPTKQFKVFENVTSQNVMTLSYFNIYVTSRGVVFLPLERGVAQALSKLGGPFSAVASVVYGEVQRKKLIAALREASLKEIINLPEAIKINKNDLNIKLGLTKASLKVNGKTVRIPKNVGKGILEALD